MGEEINKREKVMWEEGIRICMHVLGRFFSNLFSGGLPIFVSPCKLAPFVGADDRIIRV